MYWKAFHSRLPLTAGAEQVSVPESTMENNQAFLLDSEAGGLKPLVADCSVVRLCFNTETLQRWLFVRELCQKQEV